MKCLIHSLILTLCLFKISAQNYVDILKLSANTTGENKFDNKTSTTKLKQIDADLSVPVKLTERTIFLSGLIYERFETKLLSDGPIMSFGSVTLKLGANQTFNDRLSGTFLLLPKMASDYRTVQREEFQIGGIALLKFKKSENLCYKLGLYYNSELFGPFFVPMVGLYYLSPDEKLETNLLLPLMADINYKLFSRVSLGMNFNGQIRSYHLNKVNPKHQNTYVARSTNELFAYLKFGLPKGLILQTKFGYSVGRNLRVYESQDKVNFALPAMFSGDHRKQLNSDFSDGMIFQLAIIYRIKLDKK